MSLKTAIQDFPKQFSYQPVVENGDKLAQATKFLVAGMGGSNHQTDILLAWQPYLDMIVRRDYGLPVLHDQSRLIICCSYSGNTEEVIDALEQARQRNLAVAVITIGGRLLELAKQYGLPYIQIPDTGIQPRSHASLTAAASSGCRGSRALLIPPWNQSQSNMG